MYEKETGESVLLYILPLEHGFGNYQFRCLDRGEPVRQLLAVTYTECQCT